MPSRFDPLTTPADHLPWLASWLGFDLPYHLPTNKLRDLLTRVHKLYECRGTPAGVCEFVELYTGVRPALFEAFHERHVWQLGYTSILGFDTVLPAGLPDGMIVPGHTLADPKYSGLRGEYYSGIDFDQFIMWRTDESVAFNWNGNPPDPAVLDDDFSVRWTGQIVPRYSEDYTFHIPTDDNTIQLFVDGNLVTLVSQSNPSEYIGTQSLVADTSYEIVLKYRSTNGKATAKLYWSSTKQTKEIIPQSFRGEYYNGSNIDKAALVLVRTDPPINFDSTPITWFSVRWTGQILPRFSELYTFDVQPDDSVRLWIDGILIKWVDQSLTKHSISIALEAGRWYSIQLEYYARTGRATIQLYWSSRSQMKELIPQRQLYSVRDEGATFELRENEQAMLVGQTVVGESGPLNKSDFGMPLFNETAHLFTVTVPAGALPEPAQRDRLRQVIEAEKPAHTDFHLCFIKPKMRVGFQARLGIDSIVAGPPEPMALSDSILGLDSYLATEKENEQVSRVGKSAHLGYDTIIG